MNNNLKSILICFLISFVGFMYAKERNIVVTAVGSGTTRNAALHDAMRKAIVKAVGAYISTKSTMNNSDFKKEIIVNSDATVTRYNEIEAVERSGMWQIKIIAEVLPNEFLKYCPKHLSEKVSSTEIGNLLNKEKMYQNMERTIDKIFADHYLYIYNFKKVGNIRLSDESNQNSDQITVEIDYKASINQNYYAQFQKKMWSLLDQVCLQKKQWNVPYSLVRRHITEDLGFKLWHQQSSKITGDCRLIAFRHYKNQRLVYRLYLVPFKIYQIILAKLNYDYYREDGKRSCLLQLFRIKTSNTFLKTTVLIPKLSFYSHDHLLAHSGIGFMGDPSFPFTFSNLISIEGSYECHVSPDEKSYYYSGNRGRFYESVFITLRNVKIPREQVTNLTDCYLAFSGLRSHNIREEDIVSATAKVEEKLYTK